MIAKRYEFLTLIHWARCSQFFGALKRAPATITMLTCAIGAVAMSSDCAGQLPRDLRDQFEHLIEDLDPDLRQRFQTAIEKDTATVVFSLEEFKRFRDNPINPFEDLLKINPPQDSGDIALKFELPSLRNRPIADIERQSSLILSQVAPKAERTYPSVVSFWKEERNIALGAVVHADGYVITKASEVQNRAPVECEIDGQRVAATILRIDHQHDVALMKIDASDCVAIRWNDPMQSKSTPPDGSFVLTPGDTNAVLAMGTLSVQPRSTAGGEQAFLGVNPERVLNGVQISQVTPGEASYEAGLADGDIIIELGGQKITDVDDLVSSIRSHRPGDSVSIKYLRHGKRFSTRAILSGRNMPSQQAAHFKMMNRLGAILSRRNDSFPLVFQHDTPLFPEQCGGPVLDLRGNVIGLNIARQGRAASLAIPASAMATIVDDLMRQSVANRR
jgi:S1-C subfamily serine protease